MWDVATEFHIPTDGKVTIIEPWRRNRDACACTMVRTVSTRDQRLNLLIDLWETAKDGDRTLISLPTWERAVLLLSQLIARENGRLAVFPSNPLGQDFAISFPLNGRGFCEYSVNLFQQVIRAFGIPDKEAALAGNFKITQETKVYAEKRWISYEEWLRHQFNLGKPKVIVTGN